MQLTRIKLKNFRAYQDIDIKITTGLQLFIGKNDIGKSTIFEALDIFFNDKDATVKLSSDDLNVKARFNSDTKLAITCCFSLDKNDDVLVETVKIDPKEEYLLNKDNEIEIIKEWDFGLTNPKCNTFIVCNIPESIPKEILTEKQSELKKRVKDLHIESNVNQSINSSMRKGIIAALQKEDDQFIEQIIPTKNLLCEKDILDNIAKSFPDFYLFKADRKNSTSDDEVQNPMSIAVKRAFEISEVQQHLKSIQKIIESELNNVNNATIEKLKEFNVDYANNLTAKISSNWTKAISNDIVDGNSIPINKRGSGIRRLLLLSYLMVEAENKSVSNNKSNIIFAIEEPETALHPTMQKLFIDKLLDLASINRIGYESINSQNNTNQYQIFITTHLPYYVGSVKKDQIICLFKQDEKVSRYIADDIVDFIKNEMGEFPIINYKYVIFVEGENDINALRNFGKIEELKQIFDINAKEINIIPLKGGNLLKCIELDYFWDLPVKQYHLYDGDKEEYKEIIINRCNTNKNPIVKGAVTKLKEMENYIPISLLESKLGVKLDLYKSNWNNIDFDIISVLLAQDDTNNNAFNNIKHITPQNQKVNALKNYLNKMVLTGVTKQMLEEHGVYKEIETWFKSMQDLLNYSSN